MKKIVISVLRSGLPVPFFVRPVIRLLYYAGAGVLAICRQLYSWLIAGPVFRSVAEVGPGLRIERIPYITGRGKIRVGRNVYLSGKIGFGFSRRTKELPVMEIGDDTFIGHNCLFNIAGKIVIGSHCLIATGVRMQDNDGHPLDPLKRQAGEPVEESNIRPITIEDGAWIAAGSTILKGVTIGRNSVVGAGSVVTRSVLPDTVVAGNPAVVIRDNGSNPRE